MPSSRIPIASLLDPRNASDADATPIDAAVNIPATLLASRIHELPPSRQAVRIADVGDAARVAADHLRSLGRDIEIVGQWSCREAHSPGTAPRLWRPAEWLEEALPAMWPTGRALDLACGSGRNAVFAASCGWTVVAVDLLDDALQRGRSLAERHAGQIEPIRWQRLDLERGDPPPDDPFDLVMGFRYLHRPLFARFADWLRPGGRVMYETFTTLHRERHGRPARDAFVLQPGELARLLPAFDVLHFSEDWRGDGSHTASLLARCPADSRPEGRNSA
jgi:SAM-dependent methyltransferase